MTEYEGNHAREIIHTSNKNKLRQILKVVIVNAAVIVYFVFATLEYIKSSEYKLQSYDRINCSYKN